ncbi:MAG: sel1 repeat family protein, partial [Oscillospiraceae bacterium]|nr:sel1 repeat family protein [Oscillospiraceae bacterium]
QYLQQAAEQEEPSGMFLVGDCYYLGHGTEKDTEKAAEWYRKALDAGYEPDETDMMHIKEALGEKAEVRK